MLCLQIARVLSGFFLVLQIIVLLEFTFVVNEWLLERGDHWATKATLVVGKPLVLSSPTLPDVCLCSFQPTRVEPDLWASFQCSDAHLKQGFACQA